MSSATSARNTPQVPQTTGDTQYNVHDAALRGASSAFSKPPVKPKPQVNTYVGGNNGALLAATKVGTGTPRHATPQGNTSPLRRDWTGGSHTGRPAHFLSKSSSSSTLGVPDDHFSDRTPSPSNIAAKLAAARYSPMKPLQEAPVFAMPSEKEPNNRDVLPPAGSVSNVLARINSRSPGQQSLQRRDSIGSRSIASTIRAPMPDDNPTDDTSIPPTTSLVKMFEQNRPTTPTKASAGPLMVSQRAPPPVRSPKPQRKFNLPPEPKDQAPLERKTTRSPPPVRPKSFRVRTLSMDGAQEHRNFSNLRKDSLGTPPVKQKPAQLTAVKSTTTLPKPPPKRGTRQSRPKSEDLTRTTSIQRRVSTSMSMDSNENASSPSSFVSAQEEQEEKLKPTLPPPRRSAKSRSEISQAETRPKTSPAPPKPRHPAAMTSPLQIPEKFPTPRRPASAMSTSPTSDTLYHSNYQRESVKKITKHMTGESLSSAIVGAALASSRNASPAPSGTSTPPLPIRKQHHHHHSPLHHNRSPSPQKPTGKLRTTMRKDPSSSDEEEESERYKRKGTRIMGMRKKHPNKHHEGTRKRWRDAITERERKRYEGVWAANKGLHIPSRSPSRNPPPDDPASDVLNLVTKEIWLRSRLPEHALEEVWALVDGRGVGRLRREEFVVGMWLIDQRLKGRKLPVRVSESVWGSVRGVGVKVKVGAHK